MEYSIKDFISVPSGAVEKLWDKKEYRKLTHKERKEYYKSSTKSAYCATHISRDNKFYLHLDSTGFYYPRGFDLYPKQGTDWSLSLDDCIKTLNRLLDES